MNPLQWKREHQFAWAVVCLIGAIIGLLYAWFDSPFYLLSKAAAADPDWAGKWTPSRLFLAWISQLRFYWPWPGFGALIAGLAFYAAMLFKSP